MSRILTHALTLATLAALLPTTVFAQSSSAAQPAKTPNAKITKYLTYFHYNWFSEAIVRLNDGKKLKRGCWGEIVGLEKSSFVIQREFYNEEGWTVIQLLTATMGRFMNDYRKARDLPRNIDNSNTIDLVYVSCTPLKPFKLNPAITWVKSVRGGVKVAINRGVSVGVVPQKCSGSIDGVPGSSFVITSVESGDKAFATIKLGADKVKKGARVTLTCNP